MEAVGAGASILAFVAAALQTSRAIYNLVSAIQSGSPDILNLVSNASSLERILHQLLTLLDSKTRLTSSQILRPVEQSVRRCADDLNGICQQLGKLEHANSGSTKKVWRLMKIVVKKDSVHMMSRIIQQHVSMLTLQVIILSSQEASQHSQLLLHLTQSLNVPVSSSSPLFPGRSGLQQDDSFQQETSATLLAIRTRLDRIPDVAALNFTGTKFLADKIGARIEKTSDGVGGSWDDTNHSYLQLDSCDLDESLRQLSELARKESHEAHSAHADDIAEDIEILIGTLLREYHEKSLTRQKRKRDSSPSEDLDAARDLKRVKNMMSSSQCVRVNQKVRRYAGRSRTVQTTVERCSHTYHLPQGTASLLTKLVKGTKSYTYGIDESDRVLGFSALLEYLPSNDSRHAKIVANVEYHAGVLGSTTPYPSVNVSPIIPENSEVFNAIRGGDLIETQALLRAGKATLRDCDPHGRSLLRYACYYDKPDICKFLLEHGSDGNAFEKVDYGDGELEYLPLLLHCDNRGPTFECQRLLLASGADPSEVNDTEIGPFEIALHTPVFFRHIKHYGREFINTEERDAYGDTLLLRYMHRYIYNPRALKFLLDLGANPHATTASGNTCLHSCFQKACRYNSDFRHDDLLLLPSLALLVGAGADVRAVNEAGETVSDTAQQDPHCGQRSCGRRHFCGRHRHCNELRCGSGSFTLDTWVTVLKKLGYSPLDIMSEAALNHTVQFTDRYREEHYEAMQNWEPWMTSHTFDFESQRWIEMV